MKPSRTPRLLYRLFEPAWSCLMVRDAEQRLVSAVLSNHLDLVGRLLGVPGVDVNAPLQCVQPNPSDRPRGHKDFRLLHLAAKRGHFEMVELLLAHGANPSTKTSWNITPMHHAAYRGHAHIVALLAHHGASVADPFPCLSPYYEDDPYTPSSLEILENVGVEDYQGDEHAHYIARRLDVTTPPPMVALASSRPRL